jgi:DNA repair protein RadC
MDNKYLQIGEAQIDEKAVMEMAAYINHLEQTNTKLLEQLKDAKAYLAATLQQRASAESKLRSLLEQKAQQTIPITNAVVGNLSTIELINPEQWAVPEGRVITTPKSNKI